MQELMNSFVRFSAAMTLFSMQQLQNMMEMAFDSQASLNKMRDALDSVTKAVSSQMDESSKSAMESMSKLGTEVVDRTWDTLNVRGLDPREVIQTTSTVLRKATDSVTDWVKKGEEKPAGEPQAATEVLAGR